MMMFKCATCGEKFYSWDEYEHHRCPDRNKTPPEPSKHVQQAILQDVRSRVPAPKALQTGAGETPAIGSIPDRIILEDGKAADADVPDTMKKFPPLASISPSPGRRHGQRGVRGDTSFNPRGDEKARDGDVAALQALLDARPVKKSEAARTLGWSDGRLSGVLDRVPGLRSERLSAKRGVGTRVWFTTRTPDPPKTRTDQAVSRLVNTLKKQGPMTLRSIAALLGHTLQHVSMLVARADGIIQTATRDTVRGRFSYYYVGELPAGFLQPVKPRMPAILVVRIDDPDTIEQFMAIQAALDSNRDATLQCIIEGQYNDLASKGELKQ